MKAVVWTDYGSADVLQLREVEKPIPEDKEVLVKIRAATVTKGDCELRAMTFPLSYRIPLRIYLGLLKPKGNKVLGQDLAGEVEAVGKDVKKFQKGDRVLGLSGIKFGTQSEYRCVTEEPSAMKGMIAKMPEDLSFAEAAPLATWGGNALHFIRLANLKPGEKILICGAGGSMGTFAVQLAKLAGAEVTAVDSESKLEMLVSIGADHVIDYGRQDFTGNGEHYDVIFDVVGKSPYSRSLKSLNENGRYILANVVPLVMLRGFFTSKMGSKTVISRMARPDLDDLKYLLELIEAGKLKTVIDKTYALEETAEAHRYVDTGLKAGNVIISIGHDSNSS